MDSLASKWHLEHFDEEERAAWEDLATTRRFQPVTMTAMLDELLGLGFSSMAVARLVDVPVSQVQRWRTVDAWMLAERFRVADLLATCDLLKSRFGCEDPAGWFETPLVPGCVVDMAEIYCAGRFGLVMDLASGRESRESVLDAYDPEWRSIPDSMWEVFEDGDGDLSIRMKGEG